LFKKWIDLVNTRELLWADQDILNMTTQFEKIEVNPIYNVSLATKYDFKEWEIRILHHAGEKPWDKNYVMFYDLWKHWRDKYNEYIS
jgi:lipopolysaccharide biosynthesis glycosyltransferase